MTLPSLNEINQKNGPYQIVHDFEFVALNLGKGYTEIRDMSEDEKYEYMCARVRRLKERGYGGIVINTDFKNYLEFDGDVALSVRVMKYAKSIGLSVWIYDEQYYPSGAAGGLVLRDHPELEVLGLALVTKERDTDGRVPIRIASPRGHSELKYAVIVPVTDGKPDFKRAVNVSDKKDLSGGLCVYLPAGGWRAYAFFQRAIFEHSPYSRALRTSHRFVNIFDSRTAKNFFDVTYKNGYMKQIDTPLGDIVDAIFTDEPHFPQAIVRGEGHWQGVKCYSHSLIEEEEPGIELLPYIQWSEDMAERYREEYGEDLIISLPHLFEKTPLSRDVRVKFYALTSRMAKDGFLCAYRDMLEKEGVKLSGHYLLEESFDCHPTYFGDIIDHLSELSIPGCDNLRSEPDALRYSVALKLASSASHLACKDETMIEGSNMVDKVELTLERLKGAIAIMAAHGVNKITSYWGEDALPPEKMTEFAGFVTNLTSMLAGGKYKIDTLLYYPYEQLSERTIPCGYITEQQNGCDALSVSLCARTLLENQVCFDFINKSFLLKTRIGNGELILPNGERVTRLVLPDIDWLDGEVAGLLSRLNKCGVEILSFNGGRIEGLDFVPSKLSEAKISSNEISIEGYDPYMLAMHRSFEEYDLFMLVNSNTEPSRITVNLSDENNRYALVDVDEYTAKEIECEIIDGHARIDLSLSPLEAKIVMRI